MTCRSNISPDNADVIECSFKYYGYDRDYSGPKQPKAGEKLSGMKVIDHCVKALSSHPVTTILTVIHVLHLGALCYKSYAKPPEEKSYFFSSHNSSWGQILKIIYILFVIWALYDVGLMDKVRYRSYFIKIKILILIHSFPKMSSWITLLKIDFNFYRTGPWQATQGIRLV